MHVLIKGQSLIFVWLTDTYLRSNVTVMFSALITYSPGIIMTAVEGVRPNKLRECDAAKPLPDVTSMNSHYTPNVYGWDALNRQTVTNTKHTRTCLIYARNPVCNDIYFKDTNHRPLKGSFQRPLHDWYTSWKATNWLQIAYKWTTKWTCQKHLIHLI